MQPPASNIDSPPLDLPIHPPVLVSDDGGAAPVFESDALQCGDARGEVGGEGEAVGGVDGVGRVRGEVWVDGGVGVGGVG
jgi:hypothetical protein